MPSWHTLHFFYHSVPAATQQPDSTASWCKAPKDSQWKAEFGRMRTRERNALGHDLRQWINVLKAHGQRAAYHHFLVHLKQLPKESPRFLGPWGFIFIPHEYFSTASCQTISTDEFSYFHHILPNAAQSAWFSTFEKLNRSLHICGPI